MNIEIFEMLMLICFGSSWPFAIVRSLRSKSVSGKSIVFLILIFTGYLFGIAYKLLEQQDAAIWLYMLNCTMIFIEIVLYFINKKRSDRVTDIKDLGNDCPPVCLYA